MKDYLKKWRENIFIVCKFINNYLDQWSSAPYPRYFAIFNEGTICKRGKAPYHINKKLPHTISSCGMTLHIRFLLRYVKLHNLEERGYSKLIPEEILKREHHLTNLTSTRSFCTEIQIQFFTSRKAIAAAVFLFSCCFPAEFSSQLGS